MGISSHQQRCPSRMEEHEDDYEQAARFLQEFHRHSLSLHAIAEEEGEEQEGTSEALLTSRENANRGSLSKMEASMCLSSLALSQENGEDEHDSSSLIMMMIPNRNDSCEGFMFPREDSSPSSWGQFIASDDTAFARMPSSSSSSPSSHKSSSSSSSSSSLPPSSSPSSVQSGSYYFGAYNLQRHYRNYASKSRVATKPCLR